MAKHFKPENTSLEAAIAQREAKQKQAEEQNSPVVQELQKQLEEMQKNYQALQTQLQQQSTVEAKKQQDEQAKKEAEEAEKLAEDADLKRILSMTENKDSNIESLTNKELIDVIAGSIETALDARQKQQNQVLNGQVQDLSDEISKTQKAIMQIATNIDVRDVRGKYTDFDKYQKAAAEIMQDNPTLSVEQAYKLAKADDYTNVPPKEKLDRERPDTTLRRSPVDRTAEGEEELERTKQRASEGRKSGVAGVRDIINAGLDKIVSQRGETERAY